MLLVACAGLAGSALAEPRMLQSSAASRPDWLRTTPSKPGVLYFVGTAQKQSLAEAMEAAAQDAWTQASQAAGAEVSSSYHEEEGTDTSTATEKLRVAALASIQGLVIGQRYTEEWGEKNKPGYAMAWVLAVLPEAAYREAVIGAKQKLAEIALRREDRQAELSAIVARAEALILQGRQQEASGFEDKAREAFQRAQGELQLALAEGAGTDPNTEERVQGLLAAAQGELGQKGLSLADFKAAMAELVKAMKSVNSPAAVVRATYQDSAFGGPMGPRLVKLVEDELARRSPGAVIPSATFLARLSKLRLSLQDLATGADEGQIRALGVHSVIFVDYFDRVDTVELHLTLQSSSTGVLLASVQAMMPKAMVGDLAAVPPRLEVAEKALASFGVAQTEAKGLNVKLWPDHGESSTYAEGELIILHARVDRDCHLYLVHADSDGSVQLLYPNPWHPSSKVAAGQVLDLPSAKDDFQFAAVQPYGAEVIVALASVDPLPGLDDVQGRDFTALGEGPATVAKVVASYLAQPGSKRGMSRTVYTTVSGQ